MASKPQFLSREPLRVTYSEGNLVHIPEEYAVLVHSCNTTMGWGRGVAGALAKAFPAAERYERRHRVAVGFQNCVGTCLLIPPQKKDTGNYWIACLYSKALPGSPASRKGGLSELLFGFSNALEDFKVQHDAEEDKGSIMGNIYCPAMNSDLFKTPWKATVTLLEHSGLKFNVVYLSKHDPRIETDEHKAIRGKLRDDLTAKPEFRYLRQLFDREQVYTLPTGVDDTGGKPPGGDQNRSSRRRRRSQPHRFAPELLQLAKDEETAARALKTEMSGGLLDPEQRTLWESRWHHVRYRNTDGPKKYNLRPKPTAQLQPSNKEEGQMHVRGTGTAFEDPDHFDRNQEVFDWDDDRRIQTPDPEREQPRVMFECLPVPRPRLSLIANDPRYTLTPVASMEDWSIKGDASAKPGLEGLFGAHMARDGRFMPPRPIAYQDSDIDDTEDLLAEVFTHHHQYHETAYEEGSPYLNALLNIALTAAEAADIERRARQLLSRDADRRPPTGRDAAQVPKVLAIPGVPVRVLLRVGQPDSLWPQYLSWRVQLRAVQLDQVRRRKEALEKQRKELAQQQQQQGQPPPPQPSPWLPPLSSSPPSSSPPPPPPPPPAPPPTPHLTRAAAERRKKADALAKQQQQQEEKGKKKQQQQQGPAGQRKRPAPAGGGGGRGNGKRAKSA